MNTACPKCGQQSTHDAACPERGHVVNGTVKLPRPGDPPPPPEVADWVITPTPPEMMEQFRREFNEEEYWAAFHETMRTGGADIDALIARIERKIHGGS